MNTEESDNVQNRSKISERFCTKSSTAGDPLFFIGSSPSMAAKIINPNFPASGVMVSLNALRSRKSSFEVSQDCQGRWICDSGAYTEISTYGFYRTSPKEYVDQIRRFSKCGNLLTAVSQDWMCEPLVLNRTGNTIPEHQKLTLDRYDALLALDPPVSIMPVIQGYQSSDYLEHLKDYGDRLAPGAWVGIGSVCRRNKMAGVIANILKTIKLVRPDLRLHGFGLKETALESVEVRSLLYSCDSMAWSFPRRFIGDNDSVQNQPSELEMAHQYQVGVADRIRGEYRRPIPKTAGAGNGQGRKPKWNGKTIAIRVPEKFARKLLDLARQWDMADDPKDK